MAILSLITSRPGRGTRSPRQAPGAWPWPVLRKSFCAQLAIVAMWLLGTTLSVAQESRVSENQVKAAFLINLPKYVEWPAEAFTNLNSPIVIGVLGESKVTEEIKRLIPGRSINGREIVLKSLAPGEDSGVCHILFISAAEQQRSPNLLARLKNASVLTVGESNDFLERGGIIDLARKDQNIAFEVNLAAADLARIKISSRFLRLAAVVKGKTN